MKKSISAGKFIFEIEENATNGMFLISDNDKFKTVEDGDFWRIILDNGACTEIAVFSHSQTGHVTETDHGLKIDYNSLKDKDGRIYHVKFTLNIIKEGNTLEFQPSIENNEAKTRVNECQCPLVDVSELCGNRDEDILYVPYGLGQRIKNPWDVLEMYHSTYLQQDDSTEISYLIPYPYTASMAWFGIETGGSFLYLGRHDERIRNCVIKISRNPLGEDHRLTLGFVHMPMALKGEIIETAPVIVGFFDGGWRTGSLAYRRWAESRFYIKPKIKNWVKYMNGWQRIIMRSQYGEDYYKAEDLPQLYKSGEQYGIKVLFLFGWWKEGMDVDYPNYSEEAPGSFATLKENIRKVREMGGQVILTCNGNMIDPQTDYYQKFGQEVARIDINGNEYRASYVYGSYGVVRPRFGARQLTQICTHSPEWRAQLMRYAEKLRTIDPDCLFYDCFGAAPSQPCFNNKHEHKNRVDEDWVARRLIFADLNKFCGDDYVLGTEVVTDIAGACAQFVHSTFGSFKARDPYFFPQMFRQTYPLIITSNRAARDTKSGVDEGNLKLSLMMGLRFDSEIYRCRKDLRFEPVYAEEVKRLNKLREQYGEFFFDGHFCISDDIQLPENVWMSQYFNSDETKQLTVLWNAGNSAVNAREIRLAPDEMAFDIKHWV